MHLQPRDWSLRTVWTGVAIWIALQAVTTAALAGLLTGTGHPFRLADRGEDAFGQARIVLEWSGERASAIQRAQPLSGPPGIFADLTSIKFGFATTLVFEVALLASVAILVKAEDVRALLKTFGMGRYSFTDLWIPGLAVVGMYAFTLLYTLAVNALGIGILQPRSSVPVEIARDDLGLAMAGVLACLVAPLAEEFFFRGFFFGGLMRWGFWPAAAVSGFVFAAAHLNVGSLIPFFVIAMVMSSLYYWRGCLWDNIAFHFFFNTTSFIFLVSTR